MNVYKTNDISDLICGNSYVGRGIIVGKSPDAQKAVFAYFIMGRSENSRNRIFKKENENVTIYPFDEKKVSDPSLIIYSPVRIYENSIIVTNGDQTDTIYNFLKEKKSFSEALESRTFEPDAPNFTPRISAILNFGKNDFNYQMSILKSADESASACNRFTFSYSPVCGVGHFIHTYMGDGNPLPTFMGEPKRVYIENDIENYTNKIWNALDSDNKISLYVRYTNLKTKEYEDRLINKNI